MCLALPNVRRVTETSAPPGMRDRLLDDACALDVGDPAILVRIAAVCGDQRSHARDVALLVQRDAAFAATLLRIANSAAYSRGRAVGELVAAVNRLGLTLVGSLALATPGLRLMEGPRDAFGAARRTLHRHAVRTGLGARQLAPIEDGDLALAAGLVHNIGLAVLSRTVPEVFARLLARTDSGEPLRELELEMLGLTHAELGGLIAERWRYPLSLVTAMLEHDDPEPFGLALPVRAADLIARDSGVGLEPSEPAHPSLYERLGIDERDARERLSGLFSAEERLSTDEGHTTSANSIASSLGAT